MAQTLEQQIRRVIKQHYGEELWAFRDDSNYKNGTKAFVAHVAKAIRGELKYVSDLPDEVARYTKASCVDRIMGATIKKLRIKKGVSQEQLAKTVGVDADFLDALENGRIAASVNMYVNAHHSLKPTKAERKELGSNIGRHRLREEVIRDVVELYYGVGLWVFHPEIDELVANDFGEQLVQRRRQGDQADDQADCHGIADFRVAAMAEYQGYGGAGQQGVSELGPIDTHASGG